MFLKISAWFSKSFSTSKLVGDFLLYENDEVISKGSAFTNVFNFILNIFKNLFSILKLDKLLDNSIFTMPFLWLLPVVASAPFLPTMVLLALTLFSFLVVMVWLFMTKENKLKFFRLNKYVLLYMCVYMYSAITSVSMMSSIKVGLLTVGLILIYFVVVNAINSKDKFNIVIFIFLFGGVMVSLYGVYQFIFPDKFSGTWIDANMFEDIRFRVYSTLKNPNVLGEYLLLTIPFAMATIFTWKSTIAKLFSVFSVAIMTFCLLVTYSRGCYVGILAAMVVFFVLVDKRFIWLIVIGLLLLPIVMPETIITRFTSIGNLEDSSTSYRVNIWLGTINMLKDYWICGIGPGIDAYNQVYPLYSYNAILAPHSHNLFLQIICDAGIVGIISFISIIWTFYRVTFSSLYKLAQKTFSPDIKRNINESRFLVIASISAITGFIIQSMFDYTFYNYQVLLMFWMVLGFGMVAVKFANKEGLII